MGRGNPEEEMIRFSKAAPTDLVCLIVLVEYEQPRQTLGWWLITWILELEMPERDTWAWGYRSS